MINDCTFVGDMLLRYMSNILEKHHIKRNRNLWNKTFGLALKIMKAKGDVFYVNYLLQDCYIATKLRKKMLLGHAHGIDLREQIKKRKWGWMIKKT